MTDSTQVQDLAYQVAYKRARRQVKRLRAWYIHAFVFVAVVGFFWLRFLFADAFTGWGAYYRHAPHAPIGITLGWGLGLLIHGLVTWGRFGPFANEWEDRQIKRLMERQ